MIARLALLALFALCGSAAAQEDSLAKYKAYLERQPFHEPVFDQLLHAAIDAGELPQLTGEYAARVAANGDDEIARVILARLLARGRKGREALELLARLEPETAELAYLRGRVQASLAAFDEAVLAFERAAELTDDRDLAMTVWALAGRTWHRLGEDERAAEAFRAFAELDADSFDQRMEAGSLLGECGLASEAVEEFKTAAGLAAGDGARSVRAWVAAGRLEERSGRAAEAEAAYARAFARMGPGHWQRDDIFERRMSLQRALGSLDEWAEVCTRAVDESRSDIQARGFLARALTLAGRDADAREVLDEAARDFPDDLDLGRTRARMLAEAGELAEAARAFQDLAVRHPAERHLHREAGLLFASLGDDDVARRQWALELERHPRSVELHLDLARLHASFGMQGRADELLRAAIELAPSDLRPVRALGISWAENGMGARVVQLLDTTQLRAVQRGDAGVLEELAQDWLEREDAKRAERTLEQALAAGGNEQRILTTLAVLLEDGRDFERTRDVQRRLLELARTPRERLELVEQIGSHYRRSRRTRRLEQEQRRALRTEPGALLPTLLLAQALVQQRKFGEAQAELAALQKVAEFRQDALWSLSATALAQGNREGAVKHLRAIAEQAPRERRELLERVASLHRRAGDREAALAAEEELLALDPTSRSLLTDLAREQQRRQNPDRAVELLVRALALHPDDGESRLALADLYVRLDRPEDARVQVLEVLRSRNADHRHKALRLFSARGLSRRPAELEMLELERALADAPERFELGILLALYARDLCAFDKAETVVRDLLQRFPTEPALHETAALLRGLTLASLAHPFGPDELDGDLRVADLLLARGDRSAARQLLATLGRTAEAANLCLVRGHAEEARRLLDSACRADPSNAELWLRLAVAERAATRTGGASVALETAALTTGQRWHVLLMQGELHLERRYRRGAREVGKALFAELARSRTLASIDPEGTTLHEARVARLVEFYEAAGMQRDLVDHGEEVLLALPNDPPLFDAVLSRMSRSQGTAARKLLAAARTKPEPLKGWSRLGWKKLIKLHAERFENSSRRR